MWRKITSLLTLIIRTSSHETCPQHCSAERDPLPSLSLPVLFSAGHDLPQLQQIGDHTFLVHGILTPAECDAIIRAAERMHFTPEHTIFGYFQNAYDSVPCTTKTCISSREVLRIDDATLSTVLAARMRDALPVLVAKNGTRQMGRIGRLVGLNTAMRIARYQPGDSLPTHTDHVTYAGPSCCSAWTLTIYLNSVEPAHGGSTDFEHAVEGNMRVRAVQPRTGTGLLLAHNVLHSGAPLLKGSKYILRTEPIYWSGADVTGGLPPEEYALRWPGETKSGNSSTIDCELERLHASETQCPSCS